MTPTVLRSALLVTCLPAAPAGAQCELQEFGPFDFAGQGVPVIADDANFGTDVDLEGGTIAVAAMFAENFAAPSTGAVFLFRHDGAGFQAEQVLLPPDPQEQFFGFDMELDGDTLIVASFGTVYEYEFDGVQWNLLGNLPVPALRELRLDGDVLAVGALFGSAPVYEVALYRRGPGGFALEQTLSNPTPGMAEWFGSSLDLDGDTLAVGALTPSTAAGPGAAHVFRFDGSAWGYEDTVLAPDPVNNSLLFGETVQVSGGELLVSDSNADAVTPSGTIEFTGVVHAYRNDGQGTWDFVQSILADNPGFDGDFGQRLALDGDLAAMSSNGGTLVGSGAVSVFRLRDGLWIEEPASVPSTAQFFAGYGAAIDLLNGVLVGTARFHDVFGIDDVGTAYAFSFREPEDLGGGVPGTGGLVPHLAFQGAACPGQTFTIQLDDLAPGAASLLVVGTQTLPIPFSGGTFLPSFDLVVGPGTVVSPTAVQFLPGTPWPTGAFGLDLVWQAIVVDPGAALGIALSDAFVL